MNDTMFWEELLLDGSFLQALSQQLSQSSAGGKMFQCINCKSQEREKIVDLGMHPVVNDLLLWPDTNERLYPLSVSKCLNCGHYSTGNPIEASEIFPDTYPYRTGVNEGYLRQCRLWVEGLGLDLDAKILEIGCNDGSLLKIFSDHAYSLLNGIDPVGFQCSWALIYKGFFPSGFESEGKEYDLIIANNVLGHVPDLDDFIRGMKKILSPTGKISIEIPDFRNVIEKMQFDTIYHEHYSYFTPRSIQKIFQKHELFLNHLEKLPSHGGSYRYTFSKSDYLTVNLGWMELNHYSFQELSNEVCIRNLGKLSYYRENRGFCLKTIAAFGAAAKGITMLNCLGVKPWLVNFCVDETPEKIGKFLPGSRIPIYGLESLQRLKPDYLLVLPWNHYNEIAAKTQFIKEWGGKHLCLSSQTVSS